VGWLPDSQTVAIQVQSRDQKTLDLLFADAETGVSRPILREEDDHWVELHDDLRFLQVSDGFVWSSERDGFRHLYLFDLQGNLVRQLTSGEWPVSKVSKVDEKGGWVYFEGWTETPLEHHLYRVSLNGDLEGNGGQDAGGPGDVERITIGAGWHQAVLSPDSMHFIDTYSALLQPPRVHLYKVGGERLTTLEPNELPERDEYHWIEPQFVTLEAADGTTLYGRLTLPLGFAPGRRYPAVVRVYGGPHAQTVANAWDASLYGQLFAQAGYVVWELDNRGMGGRGKAFCAGAWAAGGRRSARRCTSTWVGWRSRISSWGSSTSRRCPTWTRRGSGSLGGVMAGI
jgi:dipeptidyl-peptidase-4